MERRFSIGMEKSTCKLVILCIFDDLTNRRSSQHESNAFKMLAMSSDIARSRELLTIGHFSSVDSRYTSECGKYIKVTHSISTNNLVPSIQNCICNKFRVYGQI